MWILPKRKVHPIVIPPLLFQDRHGCPNAYQEMNPSLHISEEGHVRLLVRLVNYSKYPHNSFTVHEPQSKSEYALLEGAHGKELDLEVLEYKRLQVNLNLPRHGTWWLGVEDIRFLNHQQLLLCIPECNPGGMPALFQGDLNGATVSNLAPCYPNITEKNWMPFLSETVIYSVSPFVLKSVITDDRRSITVDAEISKELDGWHGSSNGVAMGAWQLFLIHKNQERVIHRWILLDPVAQKVVISRPFVFFQHSYIEFACSLAEYNGNLYVSVGVNDCKAYVIEVDWCTVQAAF